MRCEPDRAADGVRLAPHQRPTHALDPVARHAHVIIGGEIDAPLRLAESSVDGEPLSLPWLMNVADWKACTELRLLNGPLRMVRWAIIDHQQLGFEIRRDLAIRTR